MRCLIAAVALWLLVSPAAAQRAPSPAEDGPRAQPPITQPPSATIMAEPVALMIAACDANGDAQVTRAELSACAANSFATIDTAGKGSLGYIDFADWAARWLGDRNALPSAFETDSNGDNRITLAELQAQLDKTFTRLDRDRNDVLVRSELLTLDANRGRGDAFGRRRGGDRGGRQ